MCPREKRLVTKITSTLNEPERIQMSHSELQWGHWGYAKTQKKAFSDKYSSFIMLPFVFTLQSEYFLTGA